LTSIHKKGWEAIIEKMLIFHPRTTFHHKNVVLPKLKFTCYMFFAIFKSFSSLYNTLKSKTILVIDQYYSHYLWKILIQRKWNFLHFRQSYESLLDGFQASM